MMHSEIVNEIEKEIDKEERIDKNFSQGWEVGCKEFLIESKFNREDIKCSYSQTK
jgi:hypothetical protein